MTKKTKKKSRKPNTFDSAYPVCASGLVIRKNGEDWLYIEEPATESLNSDDLLERVEMIVKLLNKHVKRGE